MNVLIVRNESSISVGYDIESEKPMLHIVPKNFSLSRFYSEYDCIDNCGKCPYCHLKIIKFMPNVSYNTLKMLFHDDVPFDNIECYDELEVSPDNFFLTKTNSTFDIYIVD